MTSALSSLSLSVCVCLRVFNVIFNANFNARKQHRRCRVYYPGIVTKRQGGASDLKVCYDKCQTDRRTQQKLTRRGFFWGNLVAICMPQDCQTPAKLSNLQKKSYSLKKRERRKQVLDCAIPAKQSLFSLFSRA